MQLNTMDCTGRSNATGRDSELGDDMVSAREKKSLLKDVIKCGFN